MVGWFVAFLVLIFVISSVTLIVVALKRPMYHERVSDLKGFEILDCTYQPFSQSPTYLKHFTRSNAAISLKKNLKGEVESVDSQNWCGYVVGDSLTQPAQNSVTSASATWNIPRLQIQSNNENTHQCCAIWVGLDGYDGDGSGDLALRPVQQIGTHSDWDASTQQVVHYAWFQVFGDEPKIIVGFPVMEGDSISAEVLAKPDKKKNLLIPDKAAMVTQFQMIIRNNTRGVAAVVPLNMSTSSANIGCRTAQFIVETPTELVNGKPHVLPLADFGAITFQDCAATIYGVLAPIQNTKNTDKRKHAPIKLHTLFNSLKTPRATPSPLTPNKKSFTVQFLK